MYIMHLSIFAAIVGATATPVHNAKIAERDDAGALSIDTVMQDFSSFMPPNGVPTEPLGNAALWQETLALDKKSNNTMNSFFNQNIAYIQTVEIDSDFSNLTKLSESTSAARGLQYLQIYPVQFNQPQAADPANVIVKISPTPQQTIKSFGASGAWWPNYLKDFPPAQQKNLSNLLFSPEGLHLSGYRYNIGASGDNDTQPISTPGRAVESFMLTNGTYDYTRDAPGLYYLKAAQEAGVPSITAFINSIPAALTTDKRACGTKLDPTVIPQFMDYIKQVLTHLLSLGISIDYISPINEPDNDFSTCTQEGMSVSQNDRADLFQQLRTTLLSSPKLKGMKILGDETSQIASQAFLEYDSWLPTSLSSKSIDAIAVHTYDFPDDATLINYKNLVSSRSSPNPPPLIKMTEISSFGTARDFWLPWGKTGPKLMHAEWDPTIDSALDMARFIWQWLVLVNAESWDWWTAVSNMMPCSPSIPPCDISGWSNVSTAAWNDGLVYIDPHYSRSKDYGFYLTKRFWVFRHFARFIRPGAVRYDIPNEVLPYGTVAIAAQNTDSVWSVIFVNRNATEQAIRMEAPVKGGQVIAAVRTTAEEDWADVVPLPVVVEGDGTVKVTLPARSVLTLRFGAGGGSGGPVPSRNKRDVVRGRDVGKRKRKDVFPHGGENGEGGL